MPFGVVDEWNAGTSLTQPQSNSTVPPRFGSWTLLDAQLGQLVGDLDEREHRRARALGQLDGVAVVVGVAVREQDVRRLELVGRHGRLRVARDERVDEDPRVAVAQLDGRLAEEADLHLVIPPVA